MGIRKVKDDTIYIEYERPAFYKRAFSTLLDFLILAIIFSGLVFATDSIVKLTPQNIAIQETYNTIREDSELYKYSASSIEQLVSIVTYYNNEDNIKDLSSSNIKVIYSSSLDFFYNSYLPRMIDDNKTISELQQQFDNDRLDYKFNGENYFIRSGEKIIENPSIKDSDFNTNFYENYIDRKSVV